jgi:hypothetical protein
LRTSWYQRYIPLCFGDSFGSTMTIMRQIQDQTPWFHPLHASFLPSITLESSSSVAASCTNSSRYPFYAGLRRRRRCEWRRQRKCLDDSLELILSCFFQRLDSHRSCSPSCFPNALFRASLAPPSVWNYSSHMSRGRWQDGPVTACPRPVCATSLISSSSIILPSSCALSRLLSA